MTAKEARELYHRKKPILTVRTAEDLIRKAAEAGELEVLLDSAQLSSNVSNALKENGFEVETVGSMYVGIKW